MGTGRVQTSESYLGCHIHVDTLVSRRIQPEADGCGCDNQWTCVHVCAGSIGTERVQAGERYLRLSYTRRYISLAADSARGWGFRL
jgi:hypothetical protein